jgi:hypothetical protein
VPQVIFFYISSRLAKQRIFGERVQGDDKDIAMEAHPLLTDALFEAFLHCKYKSHLRLKGIPGHITEFESHRRILATGYVDAARSKLLGCALGEDIPRSVPADRQTLLAGTRLILDAI